MKTLILILIIISIPINLALIIFDSEYANYTPVTYWILGLSLMLNNIYLLIKTSKEIRKSNPELYEAYSVGFMITRSALSDESFLSRIHPEEKQRIKEFRSFMPYFALCFVFFALFSLLIAFNPFHRVPDSYDLEEIITHSPAFQP